MEDEKRIDITPELKKAERKRKIEAFKRKAKDWWDDNKEIIVIVAPIVGGVLIKGIRALSRAHSEHMETRNKDLRCYDTSLGHYWELRRKLTNSEWTEIERRRREGEPLGEILDDLGVLK